MSNVSTVFETHSPSSSDVRSAVTQLVSDSQTLAR